VFSSQASDSGDSQIACHS